MNKNLVEQAIHSCTKGEIAFSKFITANDTGCTGAHQAGFHIHKNAWPLFFGKPGEKGENKDVFVTIKWQNEFETTSRFIYYGVGTRNEYRLTRFGRGFPFLGDNNVGDLLVLSKIESDFYEAFVLSDDQDIEDFFSAFGINSTETNSILPKTSFVSAEQKLKLLFKEFIEKLTVEFPPTVELANGARNIFWEAYKLNSSSVLKNPDKEILNWISTEFSLFKAIENDRYGQLITSPFPTVDDLINTANSILNRRKSRAGKSLEHHLSQVFDICNISYSSQPVTEANKKPDFIFPDIETYFKEPVGSKKLIFLGAKTTCKDRWRQIVNEAERIPQKHLFTLQQGISSNQLKEMKLEGVTLVVPKPYLRSFPEEYQADIWTLNQFISYTESIQKR